MIIQNRKMSARRYILINLTLNFWITDRVNLILCPLIFNPPFTPTSMRYVVTLGFHATIANLII